MAPKLPPVSKKTSPVTTTSPTSSTTPHHHHSPTADPKISPFSFNFQPYLPLDAAERLARYKYAGEDHSLLYQKFWKPTCVKIVELLPIWLAPNVITVGALVLVIISHLILWWYMPLLEAPKNAPEPPAWVFITSGITMFLYSLLDNLDGYQARRTKTASPLGLLTDHGCDALNAFISALSIATAISLGATWKSLSCVCISVVAFFMNTWEEYYRGSLILPVINGPNEGILVVIGLYFYTAYAGTAVWLQEITYPAHYVQPAIDFFFDTFVKGFVSINPEIIGDILIAPFFGTRTFDITRGKAKFTQKLFTCVDSKNGDNGANYCVTRHSIPLIFMLVAGVATILGNLLHVYQVLQKHKSMIRKLEEVNKERFNQLDQGKRVNEQLEKEKTHPLTALQQHEDAENYEPHGIYARGGLINHFPFVHAFNRLVPAAMFLTLATFWFAISPSDIYTKHPRVFLWTIGFLITKLTLHLMIAHALAIEFHPLRRTIIPFFTLAIHVALLYLLDDKKDNPNYSRLRRNEKGEEFHVPLLDALNERVMLVEFFVLSAVTYSHAVVNLVWELKQALGRKHMFSIVDLLEEQEKNKKK